MATATATGATQMDCLLVIWVDSVSYYHNHEECVLTALGDLTAYSPGIFSTGYRQAGALR